MSESSQKKFSDQEILELFIERVNKLLDTRLFRSGALYSYNPIIKWDQTSGLQFQSREIDEDDLRSFLVVFRPFILEKEPQYFYKVYNLTYKSLKPDYEKEKQQITHARQQWSTAMKRISNVRINILGQEFSPEYVLDFYINGHYFHSDAEFRDQLKKLSGIPIPIDKMSLLFILQELTQITVWTGKFINYGLSNNWFALG